MKQELQMGGPRFGKTYIIELRQEIARLRAALEKYGNPLWWDACLGQFEGGGMNDEPWTLAQEALKNGG